MSGLSSNGSIPDPTSHLTHQKRGQKILLSSVSHAVLGCRKRRPNTLLPLEEAIASRAVFVINTGRLILFCALGWICVVCTGRLIYEIISSAPNVTKQISESQAQYPGLSSYPDRTGGRADGWAEKLSEPPAK